MPVLTRNKQRANAASYKAMMDINAALKEAMKARDMTVEEMADILDVTPNSLEVFVDNPLRSMSIKQMASMFAACNYELTIWVSPITQEKKGD